MSFQQDTCDNYMVLKPHEGSIFDLFHLLRSHDIEDNNFVKGPKGLKETQLKGRWVITISVVVMKILLFMTKPMAWVGTMLETWLNLLSINGGFAGLILNFFNGKAVMPDPMSDTFTSTIGNFDKRMELDKNIKKGDSRYHAALAVMAAKLSYENAACVESIVKNLWEMEFLGFYDFWNDYQELSTTQAFMLSDKKENPELIVVAFRGTEPFDAYAWHSDVDLSWYEIPNIGKVHSGFIKALGLHKIQGFPKNLEQEENQRKFAYYTLKEKLRKLLQDNPRAQVIMTGHSLGGALAILFPVALWLHEETWMLERFEGVYTFGQPRVGDGKLGELMEKQLSLHGVKYFRFVYCNDIVTRLPYDSFFFMHFGTCLYYNSFYHCKIVTEEPDENYFSLVGTIPKILNAFWELIRSFTMGYTKGPDYAEGWFLRLFRVMGLIVPGMSAHTPRDYVNATRLASVFPPPQAQDFGHQSVKFD